MIYWCQAEHFGDKALAPKASRGLLSLVAPHESEELGSVPLGSPF